MARNTALEKFEAGLAKRYGEGKIAPPSAPGYQVVSTGCLTLDYALRHGGWIRGRIHELVGPPDVGKSLVSICSLREHQKAFPRQSVLYIDMEKTFDEQWARSNGLDLAAGRFLHLFPDSSEDVSDMLREAARSAMYSIIVVDSIGGMESRKALEKEAEDTLVGRNAQVITRMVKNAANIGRQTNTTILLVNQLRANLSGYGGDLSAGPKAMQHATTTRVTMRRSIDKVTMRIGGADETVAVKLVATVSRMKSGPPGRVAEFWVNNRTTQEYGPAGINAADEYVTMGLKLGVITKDGGGNYTVPGHESRVKGREAVVALLRREPGIMAGVRKGVLAADERIPAGDMHLEPGAD
jgi:recombination protein RecA